MLRRVAFERSERCRAAGAALIEHDNAIMSRVEEPAMGGSSTRTGAAMQEHDRHAAWITGFFPVERVDRIDRQQADSIRLRRWEQARTDHSTRSFVFPL